MEYVAAYTARKRFQQSILGCFFFVGALFPHSSRGLSSWENTGTGLAYSMLGVALPSNTASAFYGICGIVVQFMSCGWLVCGNVVGGNVGACNELIVRII